MSTTSMTLNTSKISLQMLKEYTVAEGVLAFSTMRKGGVSLGNYSEFNINEYCGDSSEHIWENRRLLAERLGVSATISSCLIRCMA